jgi:hypothetical protein
MKKLFPALFCFLLVACAAHPIHPGTANAFDSGAYDTLSVADSVIQSTKADLAANKFPASISGNVKSALNGLIAAYNIADTFYCGAPVAGVGTGSLMCAPNSYHSLAMAGTATPAQSTQLQNDINSVSTSTAQLTAAKAGQ